jgi:hypothetical protein
VARHLGIPVSLLLDWHSSSRMPSVKNLWKLKLLANYLGFTLEELLFDKCEGDEVVCTSFYSQNGTRYRIKVEKVVE